MEWEPQYIPLSGSDCRCPGEIQLCESPSLPVWSILSVNSVNTGKTSMSNMNSLCDLRSVIPGLVYLFLMSRVI